MTYGYGKDDPDWIPDPSEHFGKCACSDKLENRVITKPVDMNNFYSCKKINPICGWFVKSYCWNHKKVEE